MGLSIRQAAQSAKQETLNGLTVTGTISFDRRSAMKNLSQESTTSSDDSSKSEPSFDKEGFADLMNENSSLTLEEYQKYAKAESVKDFYYNLSASVNASGSLEAVSAQTQSSQSESETAQSGEKATDSVPQMPNGENPENGGKKGRGFVQSDFTLVGYSGENAMTDFSNGSITISSGEVFAEGKADNTCIVSDELAQYNNLSVGDKIKISNPNDESETYKLKIVGIFTDSSSNETAFSPMSAASNDPSNRIYASYETAQKIIDKSVASQSDSESNTQIQSSLSASYVFATVSDFEKFEQEVRSLGLDEKYTVSSSDLESYEASLVPLETLSKTAGYFLVVILAIGAVVLVVLSILTVRERKYEIGVLTAMGMKKGKVALQFVFETFVIAMAAVIIGCSIGAATSVPVTNALLSNQVQSSQQASQQVEQNFGRGDKADAQAPTGNPGGGREKISFVSSVSSAMNFKVLFEVIGIALLLVLLSGGVSLLFVMRYDPLKILANRD